MVRVGTPACRWALLPAALHLLCACVRAHVEMKEPPPRHSQFSKYYLDNDDVDYNMKSPLGPIVGYPCRNFKAGPAQGTLTAGHPFRVRFDGVATHLGGDCQFAVSYDNGTTFAVIWDKLSSCFLDATDGGYEVPVPDTIPAAKRAVFAWSWINGMGSREYYMNCADVRIENYGHQEPLTAHELLVVNMPGKATVTPRTGREEDKLIGLLKKRPFVTIGRPLDLTRDNSDGQGAGGSDDNDAQPAEEPDPVANRAANADGAAADGDADEVTSYVFTTRTVTDDDAGAAALETNLDAGFTYSELGGYRPHRKASNGLTVLSEDNEINEYLGNTRRPPGLDVPISFDMDDPLLASHHQASGDNADLWPASTGSTSIGAAGASARAPLDLGLPSALPEATPAHAGGVVTQLKTVTMNNTPYLQVVVLSNNTAVPSSLTIAYSA
ncbi:hypothetical protein LPJ61_001091 [Coemansia biformis]|uniref:Chitin-binding type-4 domain-containing protein n=1 Tax=Coemansia biformis TaxID=1286918 RepID=A0A9W8D104_9FUNG|nr:hypothetical protein LPJ61_001091 [Coemansia biformis]